MDIWFEAIVLERPKNLSPKGLFQYLSDTKNKVQKILNLVIRVKKENSIKKIQREKKPILCRLFNLNCFINNSEEIN